VDAVEPVHGGVRPRAVDAVGDGLLLEDQRVVVPLDPVVLELPRAVEQAADRGDGVVAQERDRRALVEVPREVVAGGQRDDAVAVGVDVGIEATDLLDVREAAAPVL
jgi:hypothetical protein